MARQKTITFSTDAGGVQTLTIQDYSEGAEYEYYNQPTDEALDASLRQNVRGQRTTVSVTYRMCAEPTKYRSICNNIATDLQAGKKFIYVGIDSDNLIRVTLDGGFAHKVEYANQHGQFVPAINMRAFDLGGVDDISTVFEDWRFVTESVTESRDYGLITSAVTTSKDYGSL